MSVCVCVFLLLVSFWWVGERQNPRRSVMSVMSTNMELFQVCEDMQYRVIFHIVLCSLL